jgi:O-antigen ligase
MKLRARLPWPIWLAFLLAATVDLGRRVDLGAISGLGLITLTGACVTVFLGLVTVGHRPDARATKSGMEPPTASPASVSGFLWLFLAWALIVACVRGTNADGVQNLSVYIIFVIGAALVARNSSPHTATIVTYAFGWIGLVVSSTYILSAIFDGQSADAVFSPRAFALTALIFMAVTIPLPRTAPSRILQFAPYVSLAAISLSLSRTAGLAGLLILSGRVVRGRRGGRLVRAIVLIGLVGLVSYWLVLNNATLNARVFGGDKAYAVGGVSINTEGRTILWKYVEEHIASSPWIGHGPGAAASWIRARIPTEGQPHNDYLRLIDDFGYVGFALWTLGYVSTLWGCWVRGRRTFDRSAAVPHYAAALGLTAVAIAMYTDNVVIYPFVMAPLGVLVGGSLAQANGTEPAFACRAQPGFPTSA